MSQLPALADVLNETAVLNGLAPRHNGFHLEPRCRVCRNDTLRVKVNNLLASGASYAMILRALRDDNAQLDTPDRVTIDSIRNHTTRHFPLKNVAKATYRRILEQRAQQNGHWRMTEQDIAHPAYEQDPRPLQSAACWMAARPFNEKLEAFLLASAPINSISQPARHDPAGTGRSRPWLLPSSTRWVGAG